MFVVAVAVWSSILYVTYNINITVGCFKQILWIESYHAPTYILIKHTDSAQKVKRTGKNTVFLLHCAYHQVIIIINAFERVQHLKWSKHYKYTIFKKIQIWTCLSSYSDHLNTYRLTPKLSKTYIVRVIGSTLCSHIEKKTKIYLM